MLGNYRLTDIITEWLGGGALIKGPLQHIFLQVSGLFEGTEDRPPAEAYPHEESKSLPGNQ